jgi:hypothetical protein
MSDKSPRIMLIEPRQSGICETILSPKSIEKLSDERLSLLIRLAYRFRELLPERNNEDEKKKKKEQKKNSSKKEKKIGEPTKKISASIVAPTKHPEEEKGKTSIRGFLKGIFFKKDEEAVSPPATPSIDSLELFPNDDDSAAVSDKVDSLRLSDDETDKSSGAAAARRRRDSTEVTNCSRMKTVLQRWITCGLEDGVSKASSDAVANYFMQFDVTECKYHMRRTTYTSSSRSSLSVMCPWFKLHYYEEHSSFYSALPTCSFQLEVIPIATSRTFEASCEGRFRPNALDVSFSMDELAKVCCFPKAGLLALICACCAAEFARLLIDKNLSDSINVRY